MTGKPAPTPRPDEADFSNHTPMMAQYMGVISKPLSRLIFL
ncbi:hypothetical protein [Diaphorobacter sp. J5-51]|nr:hypothetical protein [Diaphorobacter sp. J5-51]